LLQTATQVYMNSHAYTNALETVERQLRLSPTNRSSLVNKGWLCLQIGAYEKAIPEFTTVLNTETNTASELYNSALFDRAIAYLRSGRLDASQNDYEALQKNFPTSYQVYYGLGEIAYQKKDTNAAIRSYQLYLTNSPPGNTETNFIIGRLKELRPGPR
jgi:tetratricopeptide (TPR) repeat protein